MNFVEPTAALVLGAMFSKMVTALSNRYRQTLHRAEQLDDAEKLLTAHYDCLERFMSDAASPIQLKEMLLWFSDASADHDIACQLMASFRDNDLDSDTDQLADSVIDRELNLLASHRPDLFHLFENAIRTGVLATYLRWDETAKLFESLVAKTASSSHREVSVAARAARFERQHSSILSVRDVVPA